MKPKPKTLFKFYFSFQLWPLFSSCSGAESFAGSGEPFSGTENDRGRRVTGTLKRTFNYNLNSDFWGNMRTPTHYQPRMAIFVFVFFCLFPLCLFTMSSVTDWIHGESLRNRPKRFSAGTTACHFTCIPVCHMCLSLRAFKCYKFYSHGS